MSEPTTALTDLTAAGVSIWLDDLSRDLLDGGGLARLVDQRHVVGVTTNPTIFAAALKLGEAYAGQVRSLARAGADVDEAVLALTTEDVRRACDVLRPVFDRTDGVDGRVSLEVDPYLAHDTDGTFAAARHLWSLVDRPNLLVKIPATLEGLPAVSRALAAGISVNVTLIFGLDRYRAVMNAFLVGLEQARLAGLDLAPVASVASFFVSRLDTEVDRRLATLDAPAATDLRGRAAVANARLAYHAWQDVFRTPRWEVLADAGAHPQRPLWASTGVKDPQYPDTKYVTELVAPQTVNTMPLATLEQVADHGLVRGDTVAGTRAEADALLDDLERLGVSYTEVVDVLEREGVAKFQASWEQLRATVAGELARAGAPGSGAEADQ